MGKFDRYAFLTRQVEVGLRSPAATLGKKTSWVYPYVLLTPPWGVPAYPAKNALRPFALRTARDVARRPIQGTPHM
eukprot:6588685-Prymnesium_polylepis.1